METDFKSTVQKNLIPISLALILIVIVFNSLSIFRQRRLIIENNQLNKDIHVLKKGLDNIHENVQLVDIGVRAYLIRQDKKFLDPYNVALQNYEADLTELRQVLTKYNYPIDKMKPVERVVNEYINTGQYMVQLCDMGSIDQALAVFDEDRGKDAWLVYSGFINHVNQFIGDLQSEADTKYEAFVRNSLLIQLVLLSISIPVILLTLLHILNSRKQRRELIHDLYSSNKKYIFDSGEKAEMDDEKTVINQLISNLKQASDFINNLSKGNFSVRWSGMNESNEKINQENISGELDRMRGKLKEMKDNDERRLWFTEGLSRFADIIRERQSNLEELCNHFISAITTYTGSNQGTILIATDQNTEDAMLEVKGMYAYDRKKFMERKVSVKTGLAGQCYLERDTIYLTNIPSNYVYVTSGLGQATPEALLLIPIKNETDIVGVIELASFHPYEKHVIEFIEELSSNLASAIIFTRNSENTVGLLMRSQQQAEELKATEEEIRQNMEELQATQEQLSRKNHEMNRLLNEYAENEEMMKLQLEELETIKQDEEELIENLEAYRSMLFDILNELPLKVFIKDEEGKLFLLNSKVAEAHNKEIEELVGKSDFDLVDAETAKLWRQDELEIIKKGEETYVFEEDFGQGKRIMETFKKRFYIRPIKQIGLLGIQVDITNNINAATKLKEFHSRKMNAG